jgi:hypothetical protein
MVVNFVRQHWAQPGVTVTESKLLRDAVLGTDREVDIVVEGSFDGEPVVTSLEVIEHSRPATVEWAERIIAKHRHLPTNRLVLVSKTGFTKTALTAIAAEGGWVDAATPQPVQVDGKPAAKSLFQDTIQLRPTAFRLFISPPLTYPAPQDLPDVVIYDANGEELGPAQELAQEALRLWWVRRKFNDDAHHHPERDLLKGFTCGIPIDSLGYYLRAEATDEVHLVTLIEITGEFSWEQQELAFELADLGGRRYGSAEATILGQPVIWVATTNEAEQRTKVSWRTKSDKPLTGVPTAPATGPWFPGLLELQPPPDWLAVSLPEE